MKRVDRLSSLPIAAAVALGLSVVVGPSCSDAGGFGDRAREVLESDDDSSDTGVGDTGCDDDSGLDDTGSDDDTGEHDTGSDDDSGEPEPEYTGLQCVSDASGDVSGTTWLDESNEPPALNGDVVAVEFSEVGGHSGVVVSVIEMTDGAYCLNQEAGSYVEAGDDVVAHWDCGSVSNGDRLKITWYTVDRGRCDARASSVEILYIAEDGDLHWM